MKRRFPAWALAAAFATAASAVPAGPGPVTLFKQPGFAGEALVLDGTVRDLKSQGFKDQVASIVVESGAWQVCTEPNFKGTCSVLLPGRYDRLDAQLERRIESIEEMEKVGPGKWVPRYPRAG